MSNLATDTFWVHLLFQLMTLVAHYRTLL